MTRNTIYEGEMIGIILVVELLREGGGKGFISLGVDIQAAITATGVFSSKSSHYLMDIFHNDLHKLIPTHDSCKLTIQGHHNIPGNEAADKQAKDAAKGDSSLAGGCSLQSP